MEDMETMEALQEETVPNAEGTHETAEAEENETLSGGAESGAEQSEEESGDNAEGLQNEADENFLPIKFLHEEKTLNREEAIKYAQMGMNYERFEPMLAKIDYLAAVSGITRDEYIEQQMETLESNMRKEIIEKFGDNEETVNEMMEFQKQKHKKAYESMLEQEKQAEKNTAESTETRLAGEFAELVKEFPELEGKSFKDLPAAVKKAGFGGEKLINAYLYHKHSEGKKISAAAAAQESAAKKSTGSMRGDNTDNESKDDRQYLNALWGR